MRVGIDRALQFPVNPGLTAGGRESARPRCSEYPSCAGIEDLLLLTVGKRAGLGRGCRRRVTARRDVAAGFRVTAAPIESCEAIADADAPSSA